MKLSREDAIYLYRCILGREPENEQAIDQLMNMSFDLARISVLGSEEALGIFGNLLSTKKWEMKPNEADIFLLYDLFLKRPPESQHVIDEKLASKSLLSNVEDFLAADEFFERLYRQRLVDRIDNQVASLGDKVPLRKGVLLFGAYGNGNLGDSDQAQFLANYVSTLGFDFDQIYSVSWQTVGDYSFKGKKLPREAICDLDFLASFQLILIGGGGLFGVEHFPLADIRWINALIATKTPYALMSVGASIEHTGDESFNFAYDALLRGSCIATARDEESVLALGKYKCGVTKLCDPVIYDCIQNSSVQVNRKERLDIVLRYPLDESHQEFIDGISRLYSVANKERFRIIFLEPHHPLESFVIGEFPGCIICTTTEDLYSHVLDSAALISMRFHGCAAAIKAGVPIIGYGSKKIKDFLCEGGFCNSYWTGTNNELLTYIASEEWLSLTPLVFSDEFKSDLRRQYNEVSQLLLPYCS
ncbi:polysaccharide pyruvyl transferase family protein [Pseudomonas oryzihabitans]|uniref:polysaccharide pyruvyl transferase family protein n=1 Tax=Pseudomonas oryzihabitans TaxID=47885 RepID=UPI0011AB014D|nr:polysaccharide pyruvyl transferase family protein [Pseudomonas oryzihabitans]